MLKHENFIKTLAPFRKEYTGRNSAPLFRKTFTVDAIENAKLYVCGLGYGYYYINGKSVTEDLLSVPVSIYSKTLWYCVYDVSSFLQKYRACINSTNIPIAFLSKSAFLLFLLCFLKAKRAKKGKKGQKCTLNRNLSEYLLFFYLLGLFVL